VVNKEEKELNEKKIKNRRITIKTRKLQKKQKIIKWY